MKRISLLVLLLAGCTPTGSAACIAALDAADERISLLANQSLLLLDNKYPEALVITDKLNSTREKYQTLSSECRK